jgi:integrase
MSLKLNIRFNLHKPSSDEPTPIYLVYHFKNNRLCYSTGEKILPKYWYNGKDIQRPLMGSELPAGLHKDTAKAISAENKQLGNKLANIENALIAELQNYNKSNTLPEVKDLQTFLDSLLGKKIKPVVISRADSKSLIDFYTDFIDDMKKGKRVNKRGNFKGRSMVDGYIKSHGTTITNLKNYQRLYNKDKALRFDDITMEWYYKFVEMLEDENKALNTIGGQIKNIKTFLRYTNGKKLHNNTIYSNEDFIAFKEETDHIFLTEEEINSIYQLDLHDNIRLDSVRDLFIIACYTGLRYSDFSKIKSTDFQKTSNSYILNKRTQKTDKIVSIPLKRIVVEIMKKYDWNLPPAISNQKMNEYLKEIGQLAKISEPVEIVKTYKNQKTGTQKPKYELISCHTARRTLATNMYLNNFEESDIMSITGHTDIRVFRNYIKANSLQKAHKMIVTRSDYFG